MRVTLVAALLVAAAASSCRHDGAEPRPGVVVVRQGAPRPATSAPVVVAEVVSTPEARRTGLGGRDKLAADAGMLFVYPKEEPRHFWMKDCTFGLDIAFIGKDRRILNVATLGPGAGLEDKWIPSAESAGPAEFVLETNSGWFAAHGVRAGDEVEMAAAIEGVAPR